MGSNEKPGNDACGQSRGRIIVVDDDRDMLAGIERILHCHGFSPRCFSSAEDALAAVLGQLGEFDAVISDLNMPGTNGLEFISRLKAADPMLPSIVLTGFSSKESAIDALRVGTFEFLEKPFPNEQLTIILDRAVELRRLRRSLEEYRLHLEDMLAVRTSALHDTLSRLESSYISTMETIVSILELREPSTARHSKRTSRAAVLLAKKMGVDDEKSLETIRRGALLHDIGKIAVEDAILKKDGALTPEERTVMSTHSEIGHRIVSGMPGMEDAAELVLSHHERFDGKGYPRGLSGKDICLGARIFAVIDSYDAIRFSRCYRNGGSLAEVLAEISRCSGTQFDPEVVAAFIASGAEIDRILCEEERA